MRIVGCAPPPRRTDVEPPRRPARGTRCSAAPSPRARAPLHRPLYTAAQRVAIERRWPEWSPQRHMHLDALQRAKARALAPEAP